MLLHSKIHTFLFLFLALRCSTDSLTESTIDEDSVLGQPMCSLKLLGSYIILDTDQQLRAPTALTEEQGQHCTNMRQTCCSDDEFTQVFENVEENVRKIKNLGMMMGQIIAEFAAISDRDFEAIFEGAERAESVFRLRGLRLMLSSIRDNWQWHHDNVLHGIRYILRRGSGIVCGMCVPENHESFIGLDSDLSTELIVSQAECQAMLADPGLDAYNSFLVNVLAFNRLAYVLDLKYEAGMDFDIELITDYSSETSIPDYENEPCRDAQHFRFNALECAQVCLGLGLMNQNPLFDYTDTIATNFVFVHDYCGEKAYLSKMLRIAQAGSGSAMQQLKAELDKERQRVSVSQSTYSAEETEQEELLDEYFARIRQMGSTPYYITPLEEHAVDLNDMQVQVSAKSGWKNFGYGAYVFVQRNWAARTVSSWLVLFALLALWLK